MLLKKKKKKKKHYDIKLFTASYDIRKRLEKLLSHDDAKLIKYARIF